VKGPKLTPAAVQSIRRRAADGVTLTRLAKEHGVSVSYIWKVTHRLKRRDVEG
jgi:DNA-binding IscR family transcriptional regulator